MTAIDIEMQLSTLADNPGWLAYCKYLSDETEKAQRSLGQSSTLEDMRARLVPIQAARFHKDWIEGVKVAADKQRQNEKVDKAAPGGSMFESRANRVY